MRFQSYHTPIGIYRVLAKGPIYLKLSFNKQAFSKAALYYVGRLKVLFKFSIFLLMILLTKNVSAAMFDRSTQLAVNGELVVVMQHGGTSSDKSSTLMICVDPVIDTGEGSPC